MRLLMLPNDSMLCVQDKMIFFLQAGWTYWDHLGLIISWIKFNGKPKALSLVDIFDKISMFSMYNE